MIAPCSMDPARKPLAQGAFCPPARAALVTGGLGFLGSHLADELLRRGRRVRVLDDGSAGNPPARAARLREAGAELWHGSVHDAARLRAALEGIDEVYHLAAIVGVRRVARDPRGVLRSNALGARRVAGECAAAGIPLLFVSSSEVYGPGSLGRGFREEDAPGFDRAAAENDGRAAYALSKWLGEEACRERATRGLSYVIARPFNAVGAGQSLDSGALVPSLVSAALRGEPFLLEGDGGATRAFADAAEIAAAFVDLLGCESARGRVVNVGGTQLRTVREVASLVADILGIEPRAVTGARIAPSVGRIAHRSADLALLARLLGWVPTRPLRGAIERAVEGARREARDSVAVA